MNVNIFKLHPNAQIPDYQSEGAACFDFHALETTSIQPGENVIIGTGLVIQTPPGHALMIYPRSSNPIKKGLAQPHSVGVVDSDYRGPEDEIGILVTNIRDEVVTVEAGDRIAQGMIIPVERVQFNEVAEILDPSRGGHGSTGV